MKKLLFVVTVLSLSVAAFFAFRYNNLLKDLAIVETIDKSKCAPCSKYNDAGTAATLEVNLLKTMAHNFRTRTGANPSETRSVWFSLETIKNFIYQIESKSCNCDYELGIRIYNGQYPDDPSWLTPFGPELGGLRNTVMGKFNNINEYRKINTVFMVPTHKINSINYDFDPNDSTNTCNSKSINYNGKYKIDGKDTLPNIFSTQRSGNSVTGLMAQNHGDACPPIPPNTQKCPDTGAFFDF
jgi:hypothetical protein